MRKKMAGISRNDRIVWRSHEVSRIEAFSDAVFAFAVTLLIISLEVPKSFEELLESMRGFLPFAICFFLLFQVWHTQNMFFRRYGLHDFTTLALNAVLLFVVLFFVYPLKFLFSMLLMHDFSIKDAQVSLLIYIYGAGFAAIYLLFGMMYLHAYRRRQHLSLSAVEAFETGTFVYRNVVMAAVAIVSMGIAALGFRYAPYAGMAYALIGPAVAVTFRLRGKAYRKKFDTIVEELPDVRPAEGVPQVPPQPLQEPSR